MNPQSVLLGTKPALTSAHGGGVRGAVLPRRSPQFEGRFGRMFRTLPPADFELADLELLAAEANMSAEPEKNALGNPIAAAEDPATRIHDAEENSGIDAGYTYLGQFIDHDITFDPASSLQKANDPDGLVDFRTPRLDLDCLYGRGPDDQPYMYTADGKRFLLGRHLTEDGHKSPARDLPRHHWNENGSGQQHTGSSNQFARALIGDKRNDENVIVSQLQSAMLQFHNRLVDDLDLGFAETQRLVRWHYQWVVLHDYLPRIVGLDMVESILPHLKSGRSIIDDKPKLQVYHYKEGPYIPIEFAAAAYRFGHSMVRPIYRLNTRLHGGEDPGHATQDEKDRGLEGRFFIFAGVGRRGLNGFREFPSEWAIDFSLFFDINGSLASVGPKRVQPAYKIDPSLVNPLAFLPEFSENTSPPLTLASLRPPPKAGAIANLAERNLKRGLFMSLPSGQNVARAMGLEPLAEDELFVGKATYEDAFTNTPMKLLKDVSPRFEDNAPLWYYVLAEALADWRKEVDRLGKTGDDADQVPTRLGQVGGRIVAETLIGLLLGDSYSFLNQHPNWKPSIPFHGSQFTMGDLLKYALRL
jgi:hypothetical protein